MHWIKLYINNLHDPRMGQLPDRLWRRAIELNLLAGELAAGGRLPPLADMAWLLRLPEEQLAAELQELSGCGVIEPAGEVWVVTGFSERQAPSDSTERVRRFRQKQARARQSDPDPALASPGGSGAVSQPVPASASHTDPAVASHSSPAAGSHGGPEPAIIPEMPPGVAGRVTGNALHAPACNALFRCGIIAA